MGWEFLNSNVSGRSRVVGRWLVRNGVGRRPGGTRVLGEVSCGDWDALVR